MTDPSDPTTSAEPTVEPDELVERLRTALRGWTIKVTGAVVTAYRPWGDDRTQDIVLLYIAGPLPGKAYARREVLRDRPDTTTPPVELAVNAPADTPVDAAAAAVSRESPTPRPGRADRGTEQIDLVWRYPSTGTLTELNDVLAALRVLPAPTDPDAPRTPIPDPFD